MLPKTSLPVSGGGFARIYAAAGFALVSSCKRSAPPFPAKCSIDSIQYFMLHIKLSNAGNRGLKTS